MMKNSTVKKLVLEAAIFFIVILVIVSFFQNKIERLESKSKDEVWRVVARTEITPGTTITEEHVKRILVQDVVDVEGLVYRLGKNVDTDEFGNKIQDKDELAKALNDERWCIGKVATQRIYENEFLMSSKLISQDEYYGYNERLYAVPFDVETTGGFNVSQGEEVDIVVRYKADINTNDVKLNNTIRQIYASLKPNQLTDVVLSKRVIQDIRDETGTSVLENSATKPGYLCFKLTYEEINKLEWAKECGTIYIGKSKQYASEAYEETFMKGMTLPSIGMQTNLPSQG